MNSTSTRTTELGGLMNEVRQAAYQAGIGAGEPMAPLIEVFVRVVAALGETESKINAVVDSIPGRIDARLVAARDLTLGEFNRQQIEFNAAFREGAARFAHLAMKEFGNRLERQVWQTWFKYSSIFGLVVSLAGAVDHSWSSANGYSQGYSNGYSEAEHSVHQTEADLQAAFRDSPHDATTWLDLMTWNNISQSLAQCDNHVHIQNGRQECAVPLWIEPPPKPDAATPQSTGITVVPVPPLQPTPRPSRTEEEWQPINPFGVLPSNPKAIGHFGPEGSQ